MDEMLMVGYLQRYFSSTTTMSHPSHLKMSMICYMKKWRANWRRGDNNWGDVERIRLRMTARGEKYNTAEREARNVWLTILDQIQPFTTVNLHDSFGLREVLRIHSSAARFYRQILDWDNGRILEDDGIRSVVLCIPRLLSNGWEPSSLVPFQVC